MFIWHSRVGNKCIKFSLKSLSFLMFMDKFESLLIKCFHVIVSLHLFVLRNSTIWKFWVAANFPPKMHRPPIKCLLTFPQWRNKIVCGKENFCMHWIIYQKIQITCVANIYATYHQVKHQKNSKVLRS